MLTRYNNTDDLFLSASPVSNRPTSSNSIIQAIVLKLLGCESGLCPAKEIVYFESVLGIQPVNKYLMTVPPLLSTQTQADDLLTFRHPAADELLRTKLSVTSVGPAPRGIEREGYLWSHLSLVSITRPPPAEWTLFSKRDKKTIL